MPRTAFLLIALLCTACQKDADGDGYKGDDDCDEGSDAIHPGATEVCDEIDNDCDGDVDEDVASTWYRDGDGDGYGDPEVTVEACEQPEGMVESGGDCDDAVTAVHPGAAEIDCTDPVDYNCDGSVGYADADGDGAAACEDCDDTDPARFEGGEEVCDGLDNDCDDEVDEGAVDATTWYLDADEDGFGTASYAVAQCEQPGEMFAEVDGDCDDLEATAWPGAPEVCDGLDNDCDGAVDADDDDVTDTVPYYVDGDGDGFGTDASATMACPGVSGYVDAAGDCDDADENVHPDATEVCNDGADNNCDGTFEGCWMDLDDASAIFYGEDPNDEAGVSLATAGDVNADGYDDVLIGADWADPDESGTGEGAGYLVYGPVSAWGEVDLGDADVAFLGEADSDQAGYRVCGPGDVDGDGYPDILVAASQHETENTKDGAVYLLSGIGVGSVDVDLGDADASWYGNSAYDWLGGGVEPGGDIDADGLPDVLLGAAGEDAGASQAGAVFVVYGSVSLGDSTDVTTLGTRLAGESKEERVGPALAGPGDLDGDSYDDVVIGNKASAANGSDSGAVYAVRGPVSASASLSDAAARIVGASAGDWLGADVSPAGDVNADGYADFYMSASTEDSGGSSAGSVYLVHGAASLAGWDGSDADAVSSVRTSGSSKDERFGAAIDGTGDVDGDGTLDLLVGSSVAGTSARGKAWLFLGPLTTTLSADDAVSSFEGTYNDDHAGAEVSFLGDLDGSGADAIGIGAPDGNLAGTDAGAAYVMIDIGL